MPTVTEYELCSWMGQGGQIKGTNPTSLLGVVAAHTSTVMSNVIVWSPVWSFVSPTHVIAGYTGSMAHMSKVVPTLLDVTTGLLTRGSRDPAPYWQMQAYGTAVATIRGYTDPIDRGYVKGKGDGGAYSGSIPVIVDGNCYWVEVGAGSQVPAIVRQALLDAGFSVV